MGCVHHANAKATGRVGKGIQGSQVTIGPLAERQSRFFLALPILCKTTDPKTLLSAWKDWTYTITYDNGLEFSGHATIAKV